jgi:hypothetical protein
MGRAHIDKPSPWAAPTLTSQCYRCSMVRAAPRIVVINSNRMATTNPHRPKVQWRWDRFNARGLTGEAWAARNIVGTMADQEVETKPMQRQVTEEKKESDALIVMEIQKLLREAATITGMTYHDTQTNHSLACINGRDIRASWMQDGSNVNLKRLAWIFYYYGTEIHKTAFGVPHCNVVEQKVLTTFNATYVQLSNLDIKQRTCLQQLYSQKLNALRNNILRKGANCNHQSLIRKEQPKVAGLVKKNFKRGKSTFFAYQATPEHHAWHKVSNDRCHWT